MPKKTFANEWILEPFEEHPSFFTKRMFGGLAVYVFERQMMVLVEPTKTGRWTWHGILLCTERENQPAIIDEWPSFSPHEVLTKWLYIDSADEEFEPTMRAVAEAVVRDDPRFGIHPKAKKPRKQSSR